MLKSRLFEEAVTQLWKEGLISGEMHLGTGEEAIVAGIVSQLRTGDSMALDHRSTPPLLMRGLDPVLILRELLGRPEGLCSGRGGHMHLFSRDHLAASSGIVGATGPLCSRICTGSPVFAAGCDFCGLLRRRGHEPGHVDGINESVVCLEFANPFRLQGRPVGHHDQIQRGDRRQLERTGTRPGCSLYRR